MAEFNSLQGEYLLNVDGKYYNTLDISGFSQMTKNPSYCYKFYWLEAIVNILSEGTQDTTFGEIIDEMICNAWYSVREFHIHLSGLQADGFAIATMVRPDILVVDEILSVGDYQFQQKCYERMGQMLSGGTTLLYVSHDVNSVRQLCDHAIWIDKGDVKMSGLVEEVTDRYMHMNQ